jgi:hypothetical protein
MFGFFDHLACSLVSSVRHLNEPSCQPVAPLRNHRLGAQMVRRSWMNASHAHSLSTYAVNQSIGIGISNGGGSYFVETFAGTGVTENNVLSSGFAGGNESRSQNVYVNYIIEY